MADAVNQYNPNLQDPNSILGAINALAQSVSTPAPANLPSLNFTMPTGSDITDKYREFLQIAAKDPGIINYYNQLLAFAKGDTDLAKQQLETDYQTGVRHTTDNLRSSLKNLGLTFGHESDTLLDTLNKRGIALIQDGSKLAYAGGGQAATELETLNESQRLRQEAEQRTAKQNIENAGIARTKGITSANQSLRNTALSLKQGEQQDVTQRANQAYGAWQNEQVVKAQQALANQQNQANGGGRGPAPDMPTPGSRGPDVNSTQGGWRWTGSSWA